MKIITFNILKPLALTTLFTAGLNTASADPGQQINPGQQIGQQKEQQQIIDLLVDQQMDHENIQLPDPQMQKKVKQQKKQQMEQMMDHEKMERK